MGQVTDFVRDSYKLREEIALVEELMQFRAYRMLDNYYEWIKRLSFTLAGLMNLIMLMSLQKVHEFAHERKPSDICTGDCSADGGGSVVFFQFKSALELDVWDLQKIMGLLGALQLVSSLSIFVFKFANRFPLVLQALKAKARQQQHHHRRQQVEQRKAGQQKLLQQRRKEARRQWQEQHPVTLQGDSAQEPPRTDSLFRKISKRVSVVVAA